MQNSDWRYIAEKMSLTPCQDHILTDRATQPMEAGGWVSQFVFDLVWLLFVHFGCLDQKVQCSWWFCGSFWCRLGTKESIMRQCLPPITASSVDFIIDWLIDNYPKAPAIEPRPLARQFERSFSLEPGSRNIQDERLLYFEWMNLPNCSHFSCRFACRAWTAGEGK